MARFMTTVMGSSFQGFTSLRAGRSSRLFSTASCCLLLSTLLELFQDIDLFAQSCFACFISLGIFSRPGGFWSIAKAVPSFGEAFQKRCRLFNTADGKSYKIVPRNLQDLPALARLRYPPFQPASQQFRTNETHPIGEGDALIHVVIYNVNLHAACSGRSCNMVRAGTWRACSYNMVRAGSLSLHAGRVVLHQCSLANTMWQTTQSNRHTTQLPRINEMQVTRHRSYHAF